MAFNRLSGLLWQSSIGTDRLMNLMRWRHVRTSIMVAGRGSAAQIMIFCAL
jgi:hypothetical protein